MGVASLRGFEKNGNEPFDPVSTITSSGRIAYGLADARHIDDNRAGRLTAEQSRLLSTIVWRRRFVRLVGGLLLVPILSLFVTGFFVHFESRELGRAMTAFVVCSTAGLAWWIWAQLLPFVRELRDLIDGRVVLADGHVRWRRRYVVEIRPATDGGARRLEYIRPVGAARGTIDGPVPGPCEAHFLARSNIVLSAQPTAKVGSRSTAELAFALQSATGTTVDCLERCRDGGLPLSGRRRVLKALAVRMLGVFGLALYLADDWSRLVEEPMWLGVVAVGLSFAAWYLISRAYDLWRDFRAARVEHTSGVVGKVYKGVTASALWPERFLTLAGENPRALLVPASIFAAVIAGLDYHIYFTPSARVVIAIEPVDDSV